MFEPDMAEYLVYYRPVGDKRDDPHSAAAPGAEQRICQPYHPDQTGPADPSLVDILALIRLPGTVCLRIGRAAFGLRHGAKSRGVRVGAVVVHEPLVRAGHLNREAGDEVKYVKLCGLACARAVGIDAHGSAIPVAGYPREHQGGFSSMYRATRARELLSLAGMALET